MEEKSEKQFELQDAQFERAFNVFLSHQDVTPAARKKLQGLINYYRKFPHPFTKCVRDNRKRFGPRTEAVCSVVKDFVAGGTHKWRKGSKSFAEHHPVSPPPIIDDEVLNILEEAFKDEDLKRFLIGRFS